MALYEGNDDVIAQKDSGDYQQEEKKQEQQEFKLKEMKQKSIFSLAWSIADNRCYMVILQGALIALCGFSLFISFEQYEIAEDIDADCDDTRYLGPYYGTSGSEIHGCPWPETNSILRIVPPAIGVLTAVITIFLQICLGKRVLLNIEYYNHTRAAGKKIEYFDIYSNLYFRLIRKVIGTAGYLQFISFGLDVCSFSIGAQYSSSVLNIKDNSAMFMTPLYIAIPVAILLRLTHDSMYQRLYKRNFGLKFDINVSSGKDYQGTTVRDHKKNTTTTINVTENEEV